MSQPTYQDMEILRQMNEALAAGLGACHLCWGNDKACPLCVGRGRPGFFQPDPQLYEQYATPAVRRVEKSYLAAYRLAPSNGL